MKTPMRYEKSELVFLYLLIGGIGVLAFYVFRPFLYALIMAVVFATVFRPIHRRVLRLVRDQRSVAAMITTVIVLIIVILPLAGFGMVIFSQVSDLYTLLVVHGGASDLSRTIGTELQRFNTYSPVPIIISGDIAPYVRQGLNWLVQNIGPLFANVAQILLEIFIFLFALFYLFKDGHRVKKAAIALSPLQDIHDELIFTKLSAAMNAVMRGNLLVSVILGIVVAIGFAIFGVPNAVLWGSVAVIASLIPGIGTILVVFPGILYLFFNGQTGSAIGLFLWSITIVALVDNVLRAKLAGKGTRLHPFIVLLSILGAIGFFGPIGFLLGPLVLSLLFALVEIYFDINTAHRDKTIQ